MNDSPESIVSFKVVPQSVSVYTTPDDRKITTVVTEHVVALDSHGKLWVRLLMGNYEDELPWKCLTPTYTSENSHE
jgi:hypothetical protein